MSAAEERSWRLDRAETELRDLRQEIDGRGGLRETMAGMKARLDDIGVWVKIEVAAILGGFGSLLVYLLTRGH